MKKSTKIIATVIAITLVITAMLVAIYAATAGNANITANVSWTAQAGVNLEFWAKATGGDESKEIAKTTITPTTTNTDANIIGDLSCNFTDTTDDGVNNPNAIKFTYYVRNKSLTPLNIKVTKTPVEAEESGTGAENHKPKVTLNSDTEGNNTLVAVSSTSGYDLKAGDIFTYSVTLSLAKGGTGTINADFGLAPNFDAGVTFNFNVGGDSNGTIVTSVDGASPTTVSSSTLSGQTLGEYLATQQTAEYSTGWFFDEGLTKVVSDDYLEVSLSEASNSSLYCKTASIEGLSFQLSSDGNSYLVGSDINNEPTGDVIIPNMYDGKPVVGLAGLIRVGYSDYASFSGEATTSITLPNSIRSIINYAFKGCSGVTAINIPDNITSIGVYVFSDCSSLTNIKIPNSVIDLSWNSFGVCSSLISIIVDDGNPSYDSRNNCNAIIETASNTLIYGCKNTIIPNTVTSIGECAFSGCSSLKSIEIPNSVASIGYNAFSGCSGLTNVKISNGVTSLGESIFYRCSSLINIEIPNSVTSIGRSAFSECSGLTSIEIPSSVRNIGQWAFSSCSGLTNLIIPDSVEIIKEGAFNGCSGITSLIIGNGLTSIEDSVFENCSSLTSIIIGKSVTEIYFNTFISEVSAFSHCPNLTSISVNKENKKYDSRNNCNAIIETDTNKLILGSKTTVIPNGVISISGGAFEDRNCLTGTLTIPDSVTSIGDSAFTDCNNLTSIIIGNNVQTIGRNAFWGCTGLTVVNIPDSVISIDELAFRKCSGLTSVTIGSGVKSIGREAFVGCSNLTRIEIPNSVTSIGRSAFSGCSSLTSVIIGNGITSINTYTFENCSVLTKIFIPKSVTTISASGYYDSPFKNCSSTLKIYCEASEKPSGWETYWNYYASDKTLNVTWGVTRAQFDAL